MRSFNMSSKLSVSLLGVSLVMACSPFAEEQATERTVEIEYIDPYLIQQDSLDPSHLVTGNLSLELQEDMDTGIKTAFANATFYEPTTKNVLFADVGTNSLNKNVYKPKPPEEETPCGIPGYPPCPSTPNPSNLNPIPNGGIK